MLGFNPEQISRRPAITSDRQYLRRRIHDWIDTAILDQAKPGDRYLHGLLWIGSRDQTLSL